MDRRFDALVRRGVIFDSVIGSRAYGTNVDDSDVDIRRVTIIPDPRYYTGVRNFEQYGVPGDGDEVIYDVRKFAKLALNANPNILEILWSPIGSARTALGQRLFEIRGAFLSKKCHKSYGGYALSQLHKLRGQVEKEGRVRKWKHGAHLIRLLRMGCEILETGEVNIDRRGIDADELRAIRSGSYEYARVVGMADELDARLKAAAASSTLPDQPRTFMVEEFLVLAVGSVFKETA
jgi:predicted nucleotidyltransferase